MPLTGIQILLDTGISQFRKNLDDAATVMAKAATAAVKDVGSATQRAIKSNLRGGGFPSRWQSSVKASYKPKGTPSINASVHIYSTINFLSVFENGARINGKPYLWLPLPDIPQKIGSQPMRPALFIQRFGPLKSAIHSATPILLGQIAVPSSGKIGPKTARKFAQAHAAKSVAWIPVFVGVSVVQLRRRINYTSILNAAQSLLNERYNEYVAKFKG